MRESERKGNEIEIYTETDNDKIALKKDILKTERQRKRERERERERESPIKSERKTGRYNFS